MGLLVGITIAGLVGHAAGLPRCFSDPPTQRPAPADPPGGTARHHARRLALGHERAVPPLPWGGAARSLLAGPGHGGARRAVVSTTGEVEAPVVADTGCAGGGHLVCNS